MLQVEILIALLMMPLQYEFLVLTLLVLQIEENSIKINCPKL